MEKIGQDLLGTQLGTCTLKQLIGSGGMGMVFLAQQSLPVREVAIKVLRSGMSMHSPQHQEFLARFRREANVIARLDHINIMPIYEYGEQNGNAYLVMPLLTGGSLRDMLEKRGAIVPREALKYLEEAAAALQYAHEHNIVHRDIKPANILFHADGRLVLVDFGIARIIQEEGLNGVTALTGPEHFIGSVEYMAPEMVKGQQVDARTDIYELGVVLFQLLIGRVPFQGQTPLIIAAQQVDAPIPSLVQKNPALSAAVDAVVQKAMAKNPDERYHSAKEFAQAFRAAVLVADSNSVRQPGGFEPIVSNYQTISGPTEAVVSHAVQVGHIQEQVWQGSHLGQQESYISALPSSPAETQPGYPPYVLNTSQQAMPKRVERNKAAGWIMSMILLVVLVLVVGGVWSQWSVIQSHFMVQGSLVSPTTTRIATTAVTATETPARLAQDVVELYYYDINKSDYAGAYQLWGEKYQASQPYAQFAQGFAHTLHDDYTVGDIIPMDNGQYNVNVTMQATEQKDTGNVITNYRGNYIIGRENGTLKILSANIQQASQ